MSGENSVAIAAAVFGVGVGVKGSGFKV